MMLWEMARDDGCLLSTDKARLDIATIHRWLSDESYWAQGRSLEMMERAIANSLCFGIYRGERQVAFARMVTDYATFGWLCDVFVDVGERGAGLGKWLVQGIMQYPGVSGIRRIMLATRDAHELYRQYGDFDDLTNPERWMVRQRQ